MLEKSGSVSTHGFGKARSSAQDYDCAADCANTATRATLFQNANDGNLLLKTIAYVGMFLCCFLVGLAFHVLGVVGKSHPWLMALLGVVIFRFYMKSRRARSREQEYEAAKAARTEAARLAQEARFQEG